jgi:hypothetical protein
MFRHYKTFWNLQTNKKTHYFLKVYIQCYGKNGRKLWNIESSPKCRWMSWTANWRLLAAVSRAGSESFSNQSRIVAKTAGWNNYKVMNSAELEFLKSLGGLGTKEE